MNRSKHFCNHPGCNALVTDTYCEAHAPLHQYTDDRESAGARGYDSRWRKVRERYLRQHPLCERHDKQGRAVVATMVHHINPISDGGKRYDPDNLMALCFSCHEIIHGRKIER